MNRIEDTLRDADTIPTTLDWSDVATREPGALPAERRRTPAVIAALAVAATGIVAITWAFTGGHKAFPIGPAAAPTPQQVAGAQCLSSNESGLLTCKAAIQAAATSGDAPKVAGTVTATLGSAKVSEATSVRAWVITYSGVPTLPAPAMTCELRNWVVRVDATSGKVYFDGKPSGPSSPCPPKYSHPWAAPRVVASTTQYLSLEWPRGFDLVTFRATTCEVQSRSLIFEGGAGGGGGCEGGIYLLTSGSGGHGGYGVLYWTLGGKTLPHGVTIKVTLRSGEVLTPPVHKGLWLLIRSAPEPKEPGAQTTPFSKVQAINSSGRVIGMVKLR